MVIDRKCICIYFYNILNLGQQIKSDRKVLFSPVDAVEMFS